jgi:hypothetical protein
MPHTTYSLGSDWLRRQNFGAGYLRVSQVGHNVDVDAAPEDLWESGGDWAKPTAARIHSLVSGSANDDGDPAGTGARTVQVSYVNSSGNLATETVTMNGTTPVAMVASALHIYRMRVLTAGSGGVAAGAITATAATDTTVTDSIALGHNVSHSSFYRIPTGHTGFLLGWGISTGHVTDTDIEGVLRLKSADYGLWESLDLIGCGTGSKSTYQICSCPWEFEAGDTVGLRVDSDTANGDVWGRLDLVIVPGK